MVTGFRQNVTVNLDFVFCELIDLRSHSIS